MTRRQPEIGSALGLTTDQTIADIDKAILRTAAIRVDLISGLAKTIDNLNAGHPPVDVAVHLYHALEGTLSRCRS